ncbi:MAG TPA: hypothetical protein VFO41_01980 [Alphaproteobacteria bacterium]|nr:hypothetical protein [Alphaproteobacteria bacterium]
MSSTFYLYPREAFDVAAIRAHLLGMDVALADPSDGQGIVFADSSESVRAAADALAEQPPRNPWTIILHIEPARIEVFREATQPVLDRFRPILGEYLLPLTARVEDDEGRPIPMDEPEAMARYLLD